MTLYTVKMSDKQQIVGLDICMLIMNQFIPINTLACTDIIWLAWSTQTNIFLKIHFR